jgi:hypothetical protein
MVSNGWPTILSVSSSLRLLREGSSPTAQLRDARENTSDEAFVVLVLSTPGRLFLPHCLIACFLIIAVPIDKGTLHRPGHEIVS